MLVALANKPDRECESVSGRKIICPRCDNTPGIELTWSERDGEKGNDYQ